MHAHTHTNTNVNRKNISAYLELEMSILDKMLTLIYHQVFLDFTEKNSGKIEHLSFTHNSVVNFIHILIQWKLLRKWKYLPEQKQFIVFFLFILYYFLNNNKVLSILRWLVLRIIFCIFIINY